MLHLQMIIKKILLMEEFDYSWIHDERHGWTLMKEDFEIPVIDAPLVFKDSLTCFKAI